MQVGLASGAINSSFMMGGALGLAVQAVVALNGVYHAAFFVGALFAATAALLSALNRAPDVPQSQS
jgi:predicted MFS family arabinose efflux permease